MPADDAIRQTSGAAPAINTAELPKPPAASTIPPPRRRRKSPGRRFAGKALTGFGVAFMALWSLFALLPVITAVLNSFKSNVEITTEPLGLPTNLRWENYERAWNGGDYGAPFESLVVNSAIAVSVGVAVALAAGTLAGYALARAGRKTALLNRYFVILLTIPAVVTWIPLFSLLSSLDRLSSPFTLGLIYAAIVIPFVTVLMRAYFASFPLDLIEAARVDGASELRTFVRIVLPMSIGMMTIVGLIQAIVLWNELALAVIVLLEKSSQTIPPGLYALRAGAVLDTFGAVYAGTVMAVIPMIVLYVFAQRRITEGMRLGALK